MIIDQLMKSFDEYLMNISWLSYMIIIYDDYMMIIWQKDKNLNTNSNADAFMR